MGRRKGRRQPDLGRLDVESTDTERGEVEEVASVSCPHVGRAVHLASIKKSLKVAWVRVGQCAVCFKEQQTKSSSVGLQQKRVKNEVLRREFGGKLSAQEIKRLQLERAKAERLAAAEKLKKIRESTDSLKTSTLEVVTNEEKKEEAPADEQVEKKAADCETETGPASCWLCMRCGSQGCANNDRKHSLGHYKVPRSDLHCLSLNTRDWTIWCYECQTEISVDTHKKLYEVVELVKKTRDQPVSSKTSRPVSGMPSSSLMQYSTASPAIKTNPGGGMSPGKPSTNLLPRVKGLNNLGNTCFFNSVMQCLSQTKPLTQLIDDQTSSGVNFYISGSCVQSQEESDLSDATSRMLDVYSDLSVKLAAAGPILSSMAGFFREMAATSKSTVISPGQVFSQVVRVNNKFRGMQQQDSHELLRYLMEGLRSEESKRQKSAILKYFGLTEKSDPKNVPAHLRKKLHGYGRESSHTLLDKIFSGQLVSSIVCEECHHSSQTFEQFLDLSLPVLEERPAKPNKKVSVVASDDDNSNLVIRRNKTKTERKKERQKKKQKKSGKSSRKNSRANTEKEDDGEQKIREELQGTEEFEKVQMVEVVEEKEVSTPSKKLGRQLSTGSWKDKNVGEEGGYEEEEELEADADADWEWDYGDPWEEKQHIVFRSKAKSEDNLTEDEETSQAPVQLVSVKFLSDDIQQEKVVSRSPSNLSSVSVMSEESGEMSGASSDGDVEDNDNDEDQRWVMSKNLINNLTKLDSLMKTSGNLEPRLASLCDSMSSLKLEAGNSLSARQRMTAEWTGRSLASLAPRHQTKPGECSVYSCLNSFTQCELLTGSNKWACQACTDQSRQDNSDTSCGDKKATVYSPASKQLLIFCPPAILTLHLKRFQQTLSGCRKLNKHVTFPLELDLAPFCSATSLAMPSLDINNKSINYSLYGVVEHSGGLTGGHYTACVKVRPDLQDLQDFQHFFSPSLSRPGDIPKFLQEIQNKVKQTKVFNGEEEESSEQVKPTAGDKKWFLVSDSHVSEISEERVLKSQAYLLFYEELYTVQRAVMGKKHKHEKHHRYKSEDERETPVIIPKLIVKFGSENTPERSLSPAAPPLSVEESDGHSSHHHRHKEKKKKKKKDKKKSHEKDREHRKKKKRRREQEHGLESEEEEEEAPELYPSAPPQLTPQNPHSQPETPEPPDSEPEPKRICRDVSSSPPRPARTCVQKPDSLAKVLEYLLVMLEKKDINNFFANPVSDTFAPGYSKIIKEPMDFSTIREMIEEGKFKTLNQFRNAFDLICNNCMTYNGPETVYFKSAKLLQRQGQRILAPERIKALAEHLPLIKDLRQDELGFEMTEELGSELTVEDEKDVSKFIEEIRTCVSRPPGKFEAIPDPLLPEEILSQAQAAARNVADKLARKGGAPMGFLRRKPETDTTTLAIITPDPVTGRSQGTEKAVNLSQLIGKVKNGTSGLMGYKEDRRNAAKAVHPLYYGAYSSHGPTHDSTFANLTKSETELVFSTYGDDVGVSYAESIKNFSLDCEYASFIVDNLLDILTGQQHSKTKQYIEEQKTIREEEKYVSESIQEKVNFESLKSLEEDGIDMSYLQDLEKKYNEKVDVKLEKTAALINNLREVQNERLSLVPSTNMSELAGPGDKERELAGEIQGNLVDIVGSGLGGGEVGGGGVAPRDLVTTASLGAVRRQLPEII